MTRPPVERRLMTDDELRMARAFMPGRVSLRTASADKAFANKISWIAGEVSPQISEGQAHYLRRLVWTYRRQLPTDVRALVPADPTDPPQKLAKDPSPKKRTKRRFDGLDLWGGRDDA